tara:strand:+ start:105 stop:518 length:414 start_codon:yes stop_codon:yes gene_type:complete
MFLGLGQSNHGPNQYPQKQRQQNRNADQYYRENSADYADHEPDDKCPDVELQMAFFPGSGDFVVPDQSQDESDDLGNAHNKSGDIEERDDRRLVEVEAGSGCLGCFIAHIVEFLLRLRHRSAFLAKLNLLFEPACGT